ncbi:MAG: FAD:protein FMN transferase [Verrucomicrobiales bacterium]|nr:FAD:protein FMN transferase [Verrucomicrobiales bacterium]
MKIRIRGGPNGSPFLCLPSMKAVLLTLLFSVTSLFSEEPLKLFTYKQAHMGTEFTFRVWAEQGQVNELTLLSDTAFQRVDHLNRIASDYLPESEINNFARGPVGRPLPLSDDLFRLLDLSAELSKETNGAFDATAGPLIRLWKLSKKNRRLPTEEQLTSAKARTGTEHLSFDHVSKTITKHCEGMLFDLGGIAKGYAADEALKIFREGGFPRALVAASGDIVVGDAPPGKTGWRIGIETLTLDRNVNDLQTVTLSNAAISTSGDTRRYLELNGVRYSHIVSTRTGLGLTERIGASVIAPNATTSDSYATAVTLLGKKDGLQFIRNKREIECQIVALRNGQEVTIRTDGFSRFEEKETQKESPVSTP